MKTAWATTPHHQVACVPALEERMRRAAIRGLIAPPSYISAQLSPLPLAALRQLGRSVRDQGGMPPAADVERVVALLPKNRDLWPARQRRGRGHRRFILDVPAIWGLEQEAPARTTPAAAAHRRLVCLLGRTIGTPYTCRGITPPDWFDVLAAWRRYDNARQEARACAG